MSRPPRALEPVALPLMVMACLSAPLHAQSRAASDAFLVVGGDSIPLSPHYSVTFRQGELQVCAFWGREEEKCWQIAIQGTADPRAPR